jgi:hypothetical protein
MIFRKVDDDNYYDVFFTPTVYGTEFDLRKKVNGIFTVIGRYGTNSLGDQRLAKP